jgi:hypothetical protein
MKEGGKIKVVFSSSSQASQSLYLLNLFFTFLLNLYKLLIGTSFQILLFLTALLS